MIKLNLFIAIFGILLSKVQSAYDYSTSNVCDAGSKGKSQSQVAYMCNHQALGSCNLRQAVAEDGYDSFAEYGFAGFGSDQKSSCCRCFQVQIQDADAPTKDLIVQGINTGGDVTGDQIDLSMIAGGFGANNGCANTVYAWNSGTWDGNAGPAQYSTSKAGDWCSDPNGDNTKCNNSYAGGIRKRADCSKLPTNELVELCQYSFDTKWRIESTGLRQTLMKEIRCPAGLRRLSGCDRDDSSLSLPSGKLKSGDPGVHTGKLTTMWDCCKPSCSWTDNVLNSKGTAVMTCDATGNILGLGTKMECTTYTCDSSCKTCSASNDAAKCTGCNVGYYLSANPGSCVICPAQLNCLSCSSSTKCIQCKNGYQLQSDGSCQLPCHSTCTTCSVPSDSTKCTKCPIGSYLDGSSVGSCVTCPNSMNCLDCINATQCNQCKTNYELQSDKTCKAGCDSSCKTCSTPLDSSKCTACDTGFYLSSQSVGSCVKCPNNCSDCTSSSNCTKCTNNAIIVNGVCKTCDSPCSTCQTTTSTCTGCVSGYELKGNTCSPFQNAGNCHQDCLTCSKSNDQNACTSCVDGKLVIGGNCQPCQPVCKTCKGDPNSCTSCPINYKLSGTKCVGDNQDQTKCHQSCKTCSVQYDQNACTSCFESYLILGNNNCQPCQPQCKNCVTDPNNCTECASGYGMRNKQCIKLQADSSVCHSTCKTCEQPNSANACVSCMDGFTVDSNNSCQSCKSPCKTCSGSVTTCTSCITDYILKDSTCVQKEFIDTVSTNSEIFKFSLFIWIAIFSLLNF